MDVLARADLPFPDSLKVRKQSNRYVACFF